MSHGYGEYGGVVHRPFKGFGTAFIKDAVLTPEMVKDWPLANRRALHENGNIEWYGPPNLEEAAAREAGSDNKKDKQPAAPKPPRVPRTPAAPAAPATSRRTRTTS